MLRLHGFPFSNYHCAVKAVLVERGIPFEEVAAYPPADDAWRAMNPTGKFPCLETGDGSFLGESKVILGYLEDAYPERPLLPRDPLERARVRELMEVVDLYLELPARRLYPAVFAPGGPVSEETRREVRPLLAQGVAALRARGRFEPYLAGSEPTLVDFTATFHFGAIAIASKAIYGENVLGELSGIRRHRELMDRRPSVQRVRAEQRADEQRYREQSGP